MTDFYQCETTSIKEKKTTYDTHMQLSTILIYITIFIFSALALLYYQPILTDYFNINIKIKHSHLMIAGLVVALLMIFIIAIVNLNS